MGLYKTIWIKLHIYICTVHILALKPHIIVYYIYTYYLWISSHDPRIYAARPSVPQLADGRWGDAGAPKNPRKMRSSWTNVVIYLGYHWDRTNMIFYWDMIGISLGYIWDISFGYNWDISFGYNWGISLGYHGNIIRI